MSRLDAHLAALATSSPAQLRSQWEEAVGGTPPKLTPVLLRRLLAQHLQERRYGALPLLAARELERLGGGPASPVSSIPRATLTPGTRLIRQWQGRTVAVEVTETGFEWDGKRWRSLTEIAREVTGAHWSGPRFFGLNRRG